MKIFQGNNIIRNIFLGLVIAGCLHQGSYILSKSYKYLTGLQKNNFNYNQIRKLSTGSVTGIEIKEWLPSGSTLEISDQIKNLYRIAIRYQIYPLELKKEGDYILCTKEELASYPSQWVHKKLKKDYYLVAKDSNYFLKIPDARPEFSFLFYLIISLCFAAENIIVGWLILNLLNIERLDHKQFWLLSTSYLLGYLSQTFGIWIFVTCGGVFKQMNIILINFVFVGILFILNKMQHRAICNPFKKLGKASSTPLAFKPVHFSIICLGVFVFAIFLVTISTSVRDWDAMSFWILKSKVITHHQQFQFEYTHNNYYPLLWPLNIAMQMSLTNISCDAFAQWTSGFLFILFVSQFIYAFLVLGIKEIWAYAIVTLYLLAFYNDPFKGWWFVHFNNANAQNLLLTFLMTFITTLLLWINRLNERKYLWLAAIIAIGLGLIKLEGIIFILFFIFTILVLYKKIGWCGRDFKVLLLFSLPFLILFLWLSWIKMKNFYIPINHFDESISWDKLGLLLKYFILDFGKSKTPYVLALAFMSFKFYPNKRAWNTSEYFLFLLSILFVVFSCIAYVGWPTHSIKTDFQDALSRLFLDATPALTLLWASRIFVRNE